MKSTMYLGSMDHTPSEQLGDPQLWHTTVLALSEGGEHWELAADIARQIMCRNNTLKNPQTVVGQAIASLVMVLGFSIIAVPTGILASEMTRSASGEVTTKNCLQCSTGGHDPDATFCRVCGAKL